MIELSLNLNIKDPIGYVISIDPAVLKNLKEDQVLSYIANTITATLVSPANPIAQKMKEEIVKITNS